jgi:hypothetical protein
MEFKYSLQETLEARFTDRGEMEDICRHGIQGGFNGFIYTYEINEFFNEFENEIENYFYEVFDNNFIHELSDGVTSLDELRAKMVWGLVEMWCNEKLEDLENDDPNEDECYADSLLTSGV